MIFNLYLTNLLRALSLALELSDDGLSRHHWRTAMVADRMAAKLELPFDERRVLLYASLLHDLGAASRWEERRNLYHHKPVDNLYSHAELGYNLLKDSVHLGDLAIPIRHHHDNWDGSSPSGLAGQDIPLASRIIKIADLLEVLIRDNEYILHHNDQVMSLIAGLSGTEFDPELVKVLDEVARQESFWLDLTNPQYYENFFQDINIGGQIRLSVDDIIEIAELFATIIDCTSRYTGTHSRAVAEASAVLAKAKGYSSGEVKAMRIAGLLHDLGKLRIPNSLLEKPGRLTDREFALIKQHTYYTYRILNQIGGFGLIAEWAAFHHERLDGTGYPFRIASSDFRLGSRIVAVADVYVALTEDRPYRTALSAVEAEKIMRDMVAGQRIDGDLVGELWAQRHLLPGLRKSCG